MANTQGQNGQRGTVFLCFLIVLFFLIMVIIKLIKKLIDPLEGQAEDKYKSSQGKEEKRQTKPQGQDSTANFDEIAKRSPAVADDDPTGIKLARKVEEVENIFFPLVILFPLNLILGTTYAYQIVNFFLVMVPLILINVAKLHLKCFENKCVEHKCVKVILENLWLIFTLFFVINNWGATPLLQPYIVVGTE